MTHDDLMRQSAEALLRWMNDKSLPVESCINVDDNTWVAIGNPSWNLKTNYYRIAEPPKVTRVPLGPEDFWPGKVHCVRPPHGWRHDEYMIVASVTRDGVDPSGWSKIGYEQLMTEGWHRWIDGKWQPCEKEATE